MHSLSELKNFLESKQVKVKSYNGWQLVVGKSNWGLLSDVFYCDSQPVPKKEILKQAQKCIEEDKQNVSEVNQNRKWRGMRCRNFK